ncbi:hypothetical protein NP233_g783 [Leucocoprinus birnbaumii]|uniref:tRNA nucleotidyltransferase n=1 Tax=Leucocoprinus birnbaumii TaxID=56174 RepID=A0AAD5W3V9_9AGAR|nr:hypothetical protein NP233_g783 [Leucocoprinus birnbaumii]
MAIWKNPIRRIPIPSEMSVELSDAEDRICGLLDDYVKDTQEDPSSRTVCRIAGGWPRDKLLGSQSNDIDIALSNSMGLAFAEGLASYAHEKGIETGTISKIAQNPEQSKHLETATFKVFELDIDLVNLRSEEYASDSRIPTGISFGTPLQDALRRDLTINALFYNVHSREIEDFTGQGLKDLREGIIRTPLPPRETFLDDPLRVLRCIRFASRLGFDIVPEIEEAARDPIIKKAIVSKVARERVGDELSKMIKGREPLRSIELIHNLSLYNSIYFVIPDNFLSTLSGNPAASSQGFAAASILHHLLENRKQESRNIDLPALHPLYYQALDTDPTCSSRLYLAASVTPFKGLTYLDKKKKEQPVIELVLGESLKLGRQSHFLDGIPLLFTAAESISRSIIETDKLHPTSERVGIGLLLREKSVHNSVTGSHWTSSFLFSIVQELVGVCDVKHDTMNREQAAMIIERYNGFARKVADMKLQDVGEMVHILDGHETVAAVEASSTGPWLAEVRNRVIEWQLEHPEGTKEDCIEWLKEQRRQGHIQVIEVKKQANKRARTK